MLLHPLSTKKHLLSSFSIILAKHRHAFFSHHFFEKAKKQRVTATKLELEFHGFLSLWEKNSFEGGLSKPKETSKRNSLLLSQLLQTGASIIVQVCCSLNKQLCENLFRVIVRSDSNKPNDDEMLTNPKMTCFVVLVYFFLRL